VHSRITEHSHHIFPVYHVPPDVVWTCSRLPGWRLLTRHQCPSKEDCARLRLERFSSVGRAPTLATDPSVQLDLVSGTIYRRTSESRIFYIAVSDSRLRRLYFVSGTKAQCEAAFDAAVEILLLIYLLSKFLCFSVSCILLILTVACFCFVCRGPNT